MAIKYKNAPGFRFVQSSDEFEQKIECFDPELYRHYEVPKTLERRFLFITWESTIWVKKRRTDEQLDDHIKEMTKSLNKYFNDTK